MNSRALLDGLKLRLSLFPRKDRTAMVKSRTLPTFRGSADAQRTFLYVFLSTANFRHLYGLTFDSQLLMLFATSHSDESMRETETCRSTGFRCGHISLFSPTIQGGYYAVHG